MKGENVAYTHVDEFLFKELVKQERLVGIGGKNRIKYLRLNEPDENRKRTIQQENSAKEKGERVPIAEDNKTITIVSRTFSHHPGRSSAYNNGLSRQPLTSGCL